MRDLYSHVGSGKLVETVGDYEIRQISTVVTEHEGQIYPFSYLVTGAAEEDKGGGIIMPDFVNMPVPVLAVCQTKDLARQVIEFLQVEEGKRGTDGATTSTH